MYKPTITVCLWTEDDIVDPCFANGIFRCTLLYPKYFENILYPLSSQINRILIFNQQRGFLCALPFLLIQHVIILFVSHFIFSCSLIASNLSILESEIKIISATYLNFQWMDAVGGCKFVMTHTIQIQLPEVYLTLRNHGEDS